MDERSIFDGVVLEGGVRLGAVRKQGSFGYVFQGRDDSARRDVAVKVLKAGVTNPEHHAEFVNEGELLEKLTDCSHVIDLIEPRGRTFRVPLFTEHPGGERVSYDLEFPYLVLEWMDVSLDEMLDRRAELGWHERFQLVRQIALGVHQMHLRDVFHRDLKSDNVLVRLDRRLTYVAKVADLGRSRDFRKDAKVPIEQYAFGRGAFQHAPPECLWGLGSGDSLAALRRYDLYLIGSVLFELATGSSITSVVYPRAGEIVKESMALDQEVRRDAYQANINTIRAQFAPAFTMFEQNLPASIREDAGRLVRQLCDARPERRELTNWRTAKFRQPGLNWLLARLDILSRRCAPEAPSRQIRNRVHRTAS